jgi:hypothetical protein
VAKLIRNRVTERDIRDWMSKNGYEGGSANLELVELHAIERPGWKQLFRFEAKVRKKAPASEELPAKAYVWGVVLDDERKSGSERTQVAIFESEEKQLKQLERLSDGMLTANHNRDRTDGGWMVLAIAVLFVLVFFAIAIAKKFL